MKQFLLIFALVFFSLTTHARGQFDNSHQGMITILNSEKMADLVFTLGYKGHIKSIELDRSVVGQKALFYTVEYVDYDGPASEDCTMQARVEGLRGLGEVSFSNVDCVD